MENSNRAANCSYNQPPQGENAMIRVSKPFAAVLTTFLAAAVPVAAQQIENELVLITPVARTLTDPALAEFAKYAKEKWNVNVKTSALAAGTPVAYGRIVEWKGRPEADIFWGGESALFDKLAEQKLLARLDLPMLSGIESTTLFGKSSLAS